MNYSNYSLIHKLVNLGGNILEWISSVIFYHRKISTHFYYCGLLEQIPRLTLNTKTTEAITDSLLDIYFEIGLLYIIQYEHCKEFSKYNNQGCNRIVRQIVL